MVFSFNTLLPSPSAAFLYKSLQLVSLAVLVLASGCEAPRDITPRGPEVQATASTEGTGNQTRRVYTIDMPAPAATTYRTENGDAATSPLARQIRRQLPALRVDRCLERAATGYAHGLSTFRESPPLDFTEFVLHWAGCPDATAAVVSLATDSSTMDAGLHLLEDTVAEESFSHVGVVRVANNETRWLWVAMLVKRSYSLGEVATSVPVGATIPLAFKLRSGFRAASLYVTRPRGQIDEHGVGLGGDWVVASLPVGSDVGQCWVELLAEDERGPQVVALFPVAVGREPPAVWVGESRPDERWIVSAEQAAEELRRLVNHDRESFGLPPLAHDPELDAIARAHSEDMARSGFFAHVSPTTGDISDRLAAAGYRTRAAMENLANSTSLAEAQEGLMRSPGHRAAILSPDVTRLGTGAARGGHNDQEWLLTQVFSKPLTVLSPDALRQELEEAIRARRRRLVLGTRVDPALSDLAAELARKSLTEPSVLDRRAEEIGRRAASVVPRASGWKAFSGQAFNLDDIRIPEAVDDAGVRHFGIAVVAGPGNNAPHAFVVLMVS